ncbi:hypothetical protein PhCBS80983_g00876 [Powellomyces hirtus]|uniref:Ribosomal RNA-processing protein 9 n=1 Tax=Powellomyces hirtus TaxID=109895 RepID=A0A507EDJ9_9FUNG|nr:hypothetical protein PhCBS80983_g00876 [Powellomyces hirtus]
MDDFFMADPDAPRLSQKKRKRQALAAKTIGNGNPKSTTRRKNEQDDADSDHEVGGAETVDDMDLVGDRYAAHSESDSEAERETAAQKRLRLAKRYLAKVREEAGGEEGEVDAAELDRDIIADRLRDEALEAVGRLHRPIADKFAKRDLTDPLLVRTFKHGQTLHALSVTAVAIAAPTSTTTTTLSTTGERKPVYLYSASKDASIVKWDFWTGKRVHFTPGGLKPTKKLTAAYGKKLPAAHIGHNDHILTIATSSDGQFVATGGRDKSINVWSVGENKHLTSFKQHRDSVTALSFRKGTNTLYSASQDRTVKLWNIDEMSYVETLYGHQDHITALDTLARERCVTAGARDRTCRMWKIVEESQLIFRGGGAATHSEAGQDLVVMDGVRKVPKVDKAQGMAGGSLDAVAMLDEEHFVSGSDTGAISLWNINRKKPLFTKLRAHGVGAKKSTATNPPPPSKETTTAAETTETEATTPIQPDANANTITEEEMTGGCGGITSLAAVRYSDLFASGSADGYIRLWKIDASKRRFQMVACIPMPGFINSLTFFEAPPLPTEQPTTPKPPTPHPTDLPTPSITPITRLDRARAALATTPSSKRPQKDNLYLALAIGQEHRLGRWWRYKGVKNAVKVVCLGSL